MKKLKRIITFTIMFLLMVGLKGVNAASYSGRLYEVYWQNSGVNVYAEEKTGMMDYNGWYINSTKDKKVYYCIEPEVPLEGALNNSHKYITGTSNIISSSRLNKTTLNKVQLLAHYGYGYTDNNVSHTSKKWYGITQVMIWRTLRSDLTWTFKPSRNGTVNNSLNKKEVDELNNLVKKHNTKPSFASKTVHLNIGDTLTLKDSNNVLSTFNMKTSPKNISIKHEKNTLKITAKKVGKEHIEFTKSSRVNTDFALLSSSTYQDVITVGKITPTNFNFDIEVTGGSINIQKIDKDTGKAIAQTDASLKGAVYEIYNENNKLVGTITTDENGKGSIVLEYGKYTIKEKTPPLGYNLSDKIYTVELTKENSNINLEVEDKIKEGKIILIKEKGGSGEKYTLEKDASFEILDSKKNIVKKVTTNEEGKAIFTLPYGSYTIHQINGEEGYNFTKDIEVKIEEEKTYEFKVKNIKNSKLVLLKIDEETKEVLKNAVYEISDDTGKIIAKGSTKKDGTLEISNLSIGKYYITEIQAPKYYHPKKEKIPFEVKENGEVINITIKNIRKRGNLEFLKTDSTGNKPLKDAEIAIYFNETNKLVFKGKTDKDGKININNLLAGEYCIYEKKAPIGYQLSKDAICFEIKESQETVKVNMRNEEITKIPDTMLNKSKVLNALGIISILAGIIYFINGQKSKN